jgi:hypothetical protein
LVLLQQQQPVVLVAALRCFQQHHMTVLAGCR